MPNGEPMRQVDHALELTRQMIAATRGLITQTIYGAMFKDRSPPDFDWQKFEKTEFEELQDRHHALAARVERQDKKLRAYRSFLEANGKSWEAIERFALGG